MHLGIPALLAFYRRHREDNSLVLATIIATEGSTYRKPGAMMLVSQSGCFEGMISGGCLEGDLLHHAEQVFADGQVRFVTYDMHADDDLVWSLGLGCDGIIHLMLQRLDKDCDFGFLHALEQAESTGGVLELHTRGESAGSHEFQPGLFQHAAWRYRMDEDSGVMNIRMPPQTRVLVCGAGPDAVPVVRLLCELDWKVSVADHRPAFARADRFPEGCSIIRARPEKLSEYVDLDSLDAAIIMSHHLENDAVYLRQLGNHDVAYLGTLGPRARRDRLANMAEVDADSLHGPAGLDIAAELPAAIALSIVAEIHAKLNDRNGQSLRLLTE